MFLWLSPIKLKYKLVPSRLSSRETRLFRRSEPSGNCLNFLKIITCTIKKWFETFRFCSKVPSKSWKCYFREPNFKNFPVPWPQTPLEMCRQFRLSFLGRKISVGLPSWTEASMPLGIKTNMAPCSAQGNNLSFSRFPNDNGLHFF